MSKEELIILFDNFLNEKGMWTSFEQWLEERGEPSPQELGFED